MTNWERQLESMVIADHLDAETVADLAVIYAVEMGDQSLFRIGLLSLFDVMLSWKPALTVRDDPWATADAARGSISENGGPYLLHHYMSSSWTNHGSAYCSRSSTSSLFSNLVSWSNDVCCSVSGYRESNWWRESGRP